MRMIWTRPKQEEDEEISVWGAVVNIGGNILLNTVVILACWNILAPTFNLPLIDIVEALVIWLLVSQLLGRGLKLNFNE